MAQTRMQDMTADQAAAMIEAAQRRVDRQKKIVEERRTLLRGGHFGAVGVRGVSRRTRFAEPGA